jgi:SnoaL-like domain
VREAPPTAEWQGIARNCKEFNVVCRHPKEITMTVTTKPVTGAAIKQAIEGRDGKMLARFYANHAVLRVVDRNNPPSKPREIKGSAAIDMFWNDICSRAMTHTVETIIAEGNRLAFTQTCAYPDGAKVLCLSTLELDDGLIARQTVVQAWDE